MVVHVGYLKNSIQKLYNVNHTTGSLVQDIFTNIIEYFEVSATKFVEINQYISHIWEFKT